MGSGLPVGCRAWVLATTPRGLSFPVNKVLGNLPRPPPSEYRGRCLGKGASGPPSGGGAGRGCGRRGGAGRSGPIAPGEEAGQAGAPAGWRGAQCVRLRSARLAGSGNHMSTGSRVPCSRSAAASRLLTTLTMSVCCCFFFRDYGSSKRKSGKGASGRSSLQPSLPLRARASLTLRGTFWGLVLARLPRGPAPFLLPPSPAPAA